MVVAYLTAQPTPTTRLQCQGPTSATADLPRGRSAAALPVRYPHVRSAHNARRTLKPDSPSTLVGAQTTWLEASRAKRARSARAVIVQHCHRDAT